MISPKKKLIEVALPLDAITGHQCGKSPFATGIFLSCTCAVQGGYSRGLLMITFQCVVNFGVMGVNFNIPSLL